LNGANELARHDPAVWLDGPRFRTPAAKPRGRRASLDLATCLVADRRTV